MDRVKKVSFDPNVKVQNMHVWSFAYHEARKSEWMKNAADRYRFDLRKQNFGKMLTKFFSRHLFKIRKYKMEVMLAKIDFFSRQQSNRSGAH